MEIMHLHPEFSLFPTSLLLKNKLSLFDVNLNPAFLPINNHRMPIFSQIILVTKWFLSDAGKYPSLLKILQNNNNPDLKAIGFQKDVDTFVDVVQYNKTLHPRVRDPNLPFNLDMIKILFKEWKKSSKTYFLGGNVLESLNKKRKDEELTTNDVQEIVNTTPVCNDNDNSNIGNNKDSNDDSNIGNNKDDLTIKEKSTKGKQRQKRTRSNL